MASSSTTPWLAKTNERVLAREQSQARRFGVLTHHMGLLALYTPFIVCLGAGNLDMEVFWQYASQDVHLSRAFARACELAEEFADDDEDKAAILEMRKIMEDDMKAQKLIYEKLSGMDPNEEIAPSPATVKFTNFLSTTAQGKIEGSKGFIKIETPFEKTKIPAYIFGAKTSSMKYYAILGDQLGIIFQYGEGYNPFKIWIDYYSSSGYEESTAKMEELLNKRCVALTSEDLEAVEKIYQKAAKLTTEFLSSQPVVQPTVVPLTRMDDSVNRLFIFSDFDLTCTVTDSSAILAEIAILKAPLKTGGMEADKLIPQKADDNEAGKSIPLKTEGTEADKSIPPKDWGTETGKLIPPKADSTEADNPIPRKDRGTETGKLTPPKVDGTEADNPIPPKADGIEADNSISRSEMQKAWTAISEQYTAEYDRCLRSLCPQGVTIFNYEALYNDLEKVSNFEKQANSRVIESGLLRGIELDKIKKAGEHMILQDGCADFFRNTVNMKNELNTELHILSYCWCADLIRSSFSSVGCLDGLTIHSNEFIYENSVATGEFRRNIQSPKDKLETFKNILSTNCSNTKHLSLYIGDTVGDMLCLLNADVGIVINPSSSLRTLGKKYGVVFYPLGINMAVKQNCFGRGTPVWERLSGVIFTVSSWLEITAFILGTKFLHCPR